MSEVLEFLHEFARATKHQHTFLDGKCKFCQIATVDCQHDTDNHQHKGFKDGCIIQVCTCGKDMSFSCDHPAQYRITRYDDEYGGYPRDLCERCGERLR